ncbi:MAG: hypothetical protein K2N48_09970 [Muribaculaceae bacterium]|nr:hypothetical protein [Muribaculaceae bacterium]
MNEPVNGGSSLSQFYNDLKNDMEKPATHHPDEMMKVSGGMMKDAVHPGALAFRHKVKHEADRLANDCHRHLIVDVYLRTVPLDQDYVSGNQGKLCGDVDNMLAAKGMNATQYLTSCFEATHAPLLEYMLRSGNVIAQQFVEEANETLKDAQAKDIEVPAPQAPSIEDKEVQEQLVDVKQDPEYDNFINKLKEKTINKIVADVSKIISDKKEEKKMTFDTTPDDGTTIADQEAAMESTTSVGVNYILKRVGQADQNLLESIDSDMTLGVAIREATLNEINTCFKQTGTSYLEYANRIRMGKGYVITESAIAEFTEAAGDRYKEIMAQVDAKLKADRAADAARRAEMEKESQKGVEALKKDLGASLKKDTDAMLNNMFGTNGSK